MRYNRLGASLVLPLVVGIAIGAQDSLSPRSERLGRRGDVGGLRQVARLDREPRRGGDSEPAHGRDSEPTHGDSEAAHPRDSESAYCGGFEPEHGGGPYPSDWFGAQRAFPGTTIPQEKYRAAVEQANFDRAMAVAKPEASTLAALTWSNAGPFNIGGRVTALAAPSGGNPVYLASANGGVLKSTNSGVDWTPIFDSQAVFSIGALALQPGSSTVLYVGTGEANGSVDSYDGNGLYRTPDGGVTWQSLGLQATARIARVVVDPKNVDRIFVAAMGRQFSTGPDRGLYLSENGGTTWSNVLFVDDSTGVCDVAINPAHSDTVIAATWERIRRPTYRRAFGRDCGVWRSVDFGHSWARLTTGLPAANDSVGRIGVAFAPSRPSTIYAQIMSGANLGYIGLGLYRSQDGGNSWARRDLGTAFTGSFGGFCWYFGDIVVDPVTPDKLYCLGVSIKRSTTAGQSLTAITGTAHVDEHALWIDPANPAHIYLGGDGGFFSTTTGSTPWTKSVDLPITQFYAAAADPTNVSRLMGGTQDNNTVLTAGSPTAWSAILGGDGFQCVFDPLDSNVLLTEWQYCSDGSGVQRSFDGGSFFQSPIGFDPNDRYNWNTPIVMDPNNHDVVLVGSQRVYRSNDNGQNYSQISNDLSSNPVAGLVYGTLTTLDISPAASSVYYAGTDDGRVWRSTDFGGTWLQITTGLPLRYVTQVRADRVDNAVVYVTLSGFNRDETDTHVYRSTNRGTTWTSIAGNLPDVPVNDIIVDSVDPYTLYVATDVGVYATRNRGASWFPLGTGMPVQTVFDLVLHAGAHTLVAATHGRGMWKLDLAGLPTDVAGASPLEAPRLGAPSPNPSRGVARLALDLPASAGEASVAVYDVAGRRVRELHRGAWSPGMHAVTWDGQDERGARVAAGVYFVRAEAGGAVRTQRLVRAE